MIKTVWNARNPNNHGVRPCPANTQTDIGELCGGTSKGVVPSRRLFVVFREPSSRSCGEEADLGLFFLSSSASCCFFMRGITAEVTHHTNAVLLAGCPPRRNTADERRSDASTQHASSIGSPIMAHKEEVLLPCSLSSWQGANTRYIYPNRLLWIVFACVVPSRMQLTASGLHVQGCD